MCRPSAKALFAIPAGDIDIAHHALSNPGWLIALNHLADKFMPEDAPKRVIAFDQFKVGAANPSHPDADERLTRSGGFGHLAQFKLIVFQP